jgi:hypothetical protein
MAMSIVLLTASPAFATTQASASGTGEETDFQPGGDFGTGSHPHCLQVTDSSYSVDLSGSFSITNKTYTGGATLTWSTTQTYYIDEDGTYTRVLGTNGHLGCDLTTRGAPIGASITLSGSSGNTGVSCGPNAGSYGRTFGGAITVTFTGNCTVTNGTSNTASVSATFTGTLNPCFDTDPNCDVSTIDPGSFSW